ncbi:hypothetical protein [Clostridium lacusfryxellense]|uniref:hypothetical protein n=1 Tax=Clostridium lacusfryxellense TaxID=205328 RepID=UPI001C0D2FED|nr:hypothetical protein [Clostridium lacusfryxellense]MBU3113819.1 hypothetical protein [Clostridium lacusfryxellense]
MIKIRPIQQSDRDFLWDMLLEMIYFPEGEEKPNKEEFLNQPNISRYLNGFCLKTSDAGFIAEDEKDIAFLCYTKIISNNMASLSLSFMIILRVVMRTYIQYKYSEKVSKVKED